MAFYTESNFLPEYSVGYLMKRAYRYSADALAPAFEEEGMTFTQWQTMVTIYFGRASTCVDLANEMAHDKGAMTRLVDTLEERGWVERKRDFDDRRRITLKLTPAGETTVLTARKRLIACWNEWLADWPSEEVETLIAQLQRLEGTLRTAALEGGCA